MKSKTIFALTALTTFVLTAGITYLTAGCKKTDSPLGVYAPKGADVPTATPTPVSGSFNIFVYDQGAPASGVTVFLEDPNGIFQAPATTQASLGYAIFNPQNIINGVWTAGVSAQGIFGYSTLPITVTNNTGGNYSFTAPTQSVSVWSISPLDTYSYNSGELLSYGVSYVQPGNLNEPVSISLNVINTIPSDWGVTFYPSVFGTGNGINSGTVTFTIPIASCTNQQPQFSVEATKFNGNSIYSSPLTIQKNFTSHITMEQIGTGEETMYLTMQSINDCSEPWTVAWNMGPYYPTGTSVLSAGQTVEMEKISTAGETPLNVTVTGSGYTFYGVGTIGAGSKSAGPLTILNTSY
jgi:hypothetical protein